MSFDKIMQEALDFETYTKIKPDVVFLHPDQVISIFKDQYNHNQIVEELEAERLKLNGMEVRVLSVYGPCFAGTQKP